MTNDPSPTEALAAIAAARNAVHHRVNTHGGWRYDLAYSAISAAMVGAQALDIPFNVTGLTLGVLALVLMFQAETRRTGLKVTGVSPRSARWVAIVLGAVFAGAMLGVVMARRLVDPIQLPLVVAAVMAAAFVIVVIGSRLWRRVYRAEMRSEG